MRRAKSFVSALRDKVLLYESFAIILYLEHVKTKEITLKLTYQEIVRQAFRNATYTKSNQDFASPNNINNINGIKNGRG